MEQTFRRTGSGIFGIIAIGVILVIMGIPFLGMAVMTVMLLSNNTRMGLTLGVITLFCVYLLSDFTGALIAAAGAGFMTAGLRSGKVLSLSAASACGAAAMASIFGTLIVPEQSMLSRENMEALVTLYRSAGLSAVEIDMFIGILFYLLPALLALWACAGTIAAGVSIQLISRKKGDLTIVPAGANSIRLGLLPAWILIAALAVNLTGNNLPQYVQQASVNVSVFMVLPYTVVGFAIFKTALKRYSSMILLAPVAIVLPPLAIGLLMLTGILDTWFDFRSRLKEKAERNDQ